MNSHVKSNLRNWHIGLNFFCTLILLIIVLLQPVWAQMAFNTKYTIIYYQDAFDLRKMESGLQFWGGEKNLRNNKTFSQDPGQAALAPGLATKVDNLFNKVCMTLNRWPKTTKRLRIFLLSDGKQVKQRQLAFQPNQEPSLFGYGELEAFYEPRTHSIFLSMADLREGILVHEMTHFVLCEAFSTAPSHEMQEEWAQYVEIKLN